MFSKDDDTVELHMRIEDWVRVHMRLEDWDLLLVVLREAAGSEEGHTLEGHAFRLSHVSKRELILGLVNRLNEGNANFRIHEPAGTEVTK